jgi:hypothetical protein
MFQVQRAIIRPKTEQSPGTFNDRALCGIPYGLHKKLKGKGLPQQAEVARAVPGKLMSRIFLTFSISRVVGRQPYAPAAFTPGEIPGNHF